MREPALILFRIGAGVQKGMVVLCNLNYCTTFFAGTQDVVTDFFPISSKSCLALLFPARQISGLPCDVKSFPALFGVIAPSPATWTALSLALLLPAGILLCLQVLCVSAASACFYRSQALRRRAYFAIAPSVYKRDRQ